MTLSVRYSARTEPGPVRGNNEDSLYAGPRLLAVADGMGGHVGGDDASRAVINAILSLDDDIPDDLLTALRDATATANQAIRAAVRDEPALDGMGTTLTALLFEGARVGVAHIGDSRAYLLRDGEFAQITHDDTWVQSLVDDGRLTKEEAAQHPQRSVIMRVLTGEDIEPDVSIREARAGDRYLICSDGLTDYTEPDDVEAAMHIEDRDEVTQRLIELALGGGGNDNISCIVADVVDGEGDDKPVLAGAVVEPPARRSRMRLRRPGTRRTAAKDEEPDDGTEDDAADDEAADERPPRRTQRALIIGTVVIVAIAGILYGGYRWTQTQYFIALDGDTVAVYQGVNVSIAGMHLYDQVSGSELTLSDLVPAARSRVSDGISANSRSQAESILANLIDNQRLPPCPTATPTPTQTATKAPKNKMPAPTPSPEPMQPTPIPGKDCR